MQLEELMDGQTFKPFRICMSDGKTFDVTNHDMAFVKKNEIEVGLVIDSRGITEYSTRCVLIHITHLEDLRGQKA
ncbi:MAG: hypothetical protein ABIR24_08585 [Verrucomicrobiota bacterium]